VPALRQYSSPNVAIPFIDHSSSMWNFRCMTNCCIAVLAQ
jgi:hypothetical protein